MSRKPKDSPDFGPRVPAHSAEWRLNDEGQVDIIVPRYGKNWIGRKFEQWFKPKPIHIHLDALGTAVWQTIDGRRTVAEIGAHLEAEQQPPLDQLEHRLATFLAHLANHRFIRWVERN